MEHLEQYLGGIPNGSFILVSYDQYSTGWKFALEMFKREVAEGRFGVFVNTILPMSKVFYRAHVAGLDMDRYGMKGNLVVVNLFPERCNKPYIYDVGKVTEETLVPKFHSVMQEVETLYDLRNAVGVLATIDGLYELMGEQALKRFIMATAIATDKLTRKYNYHTILIEKYEILPKPLHAWLVSMSEYYLLTRGMISEEGYSETLAILKSPIEGFEPKVYVSKRKSEPWGKRT
ncbi:MAG: hypothetical protein GXO14_06580 [Thermococci archaeon]|nr:hypothetical protein [Thermococci archaeon]